MNPLVSVSIITYNHKRFIAQCLEGVLQQITNFDFEVIIGDDSSTDGTTEICQEYQNKYPDKIKLNIRAREHVIYINKKPTGRHNFIENLKLCNGNYIALTDGDDYWTDPYKLQKQVDFMQSSPEYGICFHNVNMLSEETKSISKDIIARNVNETTSVDDLLRGNYIHMTSVLIRNNFSLPEWFKKAELGDWAFYLIVVGNQKIKKITDIMAVYRVHHTGIWSGESEKFRVFSLYKVNKLILKKLKLNQEQKKTIKRQLKRYKRIINTDILVMRFYRKILKILK